MGDRKLWMLVAVVAAVFAMVLGPRPTALPDDTTGDAALARRVRDAVGARPGTQALAVAEVTADGIRIAGLGRTRSGAPVDGSTAFEIGSVTKALTGALLADMDAAGIVDVDDRVADITDDDRLRAAPVGDVTLRELAQHRSGLPRLTLGGPLHAARALLANVTGGNPYPGWSPDGVAAAAAGRQLEGRGTDAYSNLGAARRCARCGRRDDVPAPAA